MLNFTNHPFGFAGLLVFICLLCPFDYKQDIKSNDSYAIKRLVKEDSQGKSSDILLIDEQISEFMSKYDVPGASVAITKKGKLVFAKGYGYAIKATGEKVTPFHLFRIGSLSKPVTSVAIMKLVEEGKLSLDDKVFGPAGILHYVTNFADSMQVKKITVRHLLEHTAGGWTNDEQDPMFQYPDYSQEQLISHIVATRLLDYAPGTKYVYSNFGYCILGRIIEKVSGQSYESYVKHYILEPLGITHMHIGGDTETDKQIGEVSYYSQDQISAYGMKIKRMDAPGGWIASPSDLLKLLVHVDNFDPSADILSSSSIAEMFTPSKINSGYALGWEVNQYNNWWHSGSLPGSGAFFVRTQDEYCWAMLVNTRSTDRRAFFTDMDRKMRKIITDVKEWPSQELFEDKGQTPYVISSTN